MKYYLKGTWQDDYSEVTKEQYINAERNASFCPKCGYTDIATASFFGRGISGKVDYEVKKEENV